MKKFMKKISLLTVFVMGMTSLSGCAKPEADKPATSTNTDASTEKPKDDKASTEKVKMDFIWFSDGVEGEVTKAIIEDYKLVKPNVEITLIETPYAELENKLMVMISGGEPPALARLTNVGKFKDHLVDLSTQIENIESITDQISESVKPQFVIEGKVLGFATDVTANGLIYNKTAFDKAGVKVPTKEDEIWTTQEWMDAMKAVQASGAAKYGLVTDKSTHRWSTLLYEAGGRHLDDEGKVIINSKEGVAAVETMVKLHKDGISPDSVWVGSENPNNLFRTGQIAMHLAGSWMMTNYRDNIKDFEWGVTYLPKDAIRSSVVGGKSVGAFKNSKTEKEAAEFLEYFLSKEVNAKYCQESLFLSPRIDNAVLDYSFGKEYFEIFSNELAITPQYASLDFTNPYYIPSITNDLRDGISDVIAGKVGAQEMLDRIAKQGQEALDAAK